MDERSKNFPFPVRVTLRRKCREGFYLLINGSRLRFGTRAAAVAGVLSFLALQKVQIVTVREFAERNRKRIARVQREAS